MRTAAYVHEDHLSADDLLFEREVACCRRRLYPGALNMTGNPNDAEDLIQETLTRAYAGLKSFTPGTNAQAWLNRIMANAFVNTCRKRDREPMHVLSPEIDEPRPAIAMRAIGGTAANIPSAEDEVLGQFAHSEFRQALEDLPECYRATIYLADVVGYSYHDVAEMIGVPVGTVMSRLHRARRRLRKQLTVPVQPQSATETVVT